MLFRSGFFLDASVLCTLARMKVGVIFGQRLRDNAVSFPQAVESWAEVCAVKKRWVLGGMRPVPVFQIRLFAHGWLALALMNPSRER